MVSSLRPARAEDVDAIRSLVETAYAIYLDRIDRKPAPMQADYAELVSKGVVSLIEIEGTPAAIIVCYPRGNCLHVENVAVSPSWQGRGLGKQLMRFAEDEARSNRLPTVELYTNGVMTENVPFYERLGYRTISRAYQDGYDRIFFRKELEAADEG